MRLDQYRYSGAGRFMPVPPTPEYPVHATKLQTLISKHSLYRPVHMFSTCSAQELPSTKVWIRAGV
jgi:hypothetical protein